MQKITVRYWVGTTQHVGTASTYAGAMRIASRNRNAYHPTFWLGDERLHDFGGCLVSEREIERQSREPHTALQAAC